MPGRPPTLRRRLAAITLTTTLLVLAVCGVLLGLTTLLHRTTVTLSETMERVRLAEEAEITLLLHASSSDPLLRRHLEAQLRRKLNATRLVAVDHDKALLSEVERSINEYIESSAPMEKSSVQHVAAYRALDALVTVNLDASHSARSVADRWNRTAGIVAVCLAMLILVVTGGFLRWVERNAFKPVFALADIMQKFGRGDHGVRAPVRGHSEVEIMGRRFNEMADAVAAQRQAQIAFLGGVAHDLRGPLNAIKLAVEAMPLVDDNQRPQTLAIANRQVARLERMIGDFLDIAKIDAGELDLRWADADLQSIVRHSVTSLQGTSGELQVRLNMPAEPVSVRCDPSRLEQVVTNLVSNAIKYSPRGGAVVVDLSVEGRDAVLCVRDEGIGIAPEDRERIFEPFRRVGPSTEAVAGVGLGLFVVRRIVEAHGGRVELTSEEGKGSTFAVYLPLPLAAAA